LLYFTVIKSTVLLVSPSIEKPVVQQPVHHVTLPGPLEISLFIIVIVLMIAITIYAFIKIPTTLIKASDKAIHKTAQITTPTVMKTLHQKNTSKNRLVFSTRLILVAKLLLILIPVIAAAISDTIIKQSLDHAVAMAVAYTLAGISVLFFILQYSLAYLLRVNSSQLR